MKRVNYLILVLILFSSCQNNKKKEEKNLETVTLSEDDKHDLMNVITRFARAYLSQDNAKANALIHPRLGISILHRPGVMDELTQVDSLNFTQPIPAHYAYEKFDNPHALLFDKLPEFDCEDMHWDKQGFYCDTTESAHVLSDLNIFYNEIDEPFPLDNQELQKLEQDSFRVILTQQSALIFHVKRFEGKWYITLLDRAYASCDA